MTKQIEQAYKDVEQELQSKQLEELKGYFRATLSKIEEKKKEKERIEEELRVLKLDLEDMKNGKFDSIQERQRKSPLAGLVSQVTVPTFPQPWFSPTISGGANWFSGTYSVTTNGETKTYYF